MKWYRTIGTIIFCFFYLLSSGQLSVGGKPRSIITLKSSIRPVVLMPEVDNSLLLQSELRISPDSAVLKPLRFAYPFEVNLDPLNSGVWGISDDGYQVWQLEIRSKGAFSINLKFEDLRLPASARLFVFSSDMEHILGAFTGSNNPETGIFPVSPVKGDDIFVQYEIPPSSGKQRDFRITRVNHDFLNILKRGDRRPLGITAGSCNPDINCSAFNHWVDVSNSVCRIIIDGIEICTGTLLNNTSEDQTPYILTANHCISDHPKGYSSVFLFNYESPYCGPLDGDVTNSISGSMLKATFDSLDFALLQLYTIPPPQFRPFFAGWSHSGAIPDSVSCIHHPQGDIKKIAIDRNSPVIATYSSDYVKNGCLKTLKWEIGTTEAGSSGGPYFNNQLQLIGTLTGGAATCSNSVNDYFSRFDKAWDYRSEPDKQLKTWLDPSNKGIKSLWGKNFNNGVDYCDAFTNLKDGDTHELVKIVGATKVFSGYWTGTNNEGYTEFAEKFFIKGDEAVQGVLLGVGKVKLKQLNSDSRITVKVYEGNGLPSEEIYSQQVNIKDMAQDAMNYIKFTKAVTPIDSFFVGFELSHVQAGDTFALYQTIRKVNAPNSFLLKKGNLWSKFRDLYPANNSAALVTEVLACNVDTFKNDTPLVEDTLDILVYPNPFDGIINLEAGDLFEQEMIRVFNLVGQKIAVKITRTAPLKARIDFTGNIPGIYIIQLRDQKRNVSKKVAFFPR